MTTATARKLRSKIDLSPLDDRVIVTRDESEETTHGGIVLPDTAREKVNQGRVIAIGPGKHDRNGNRIPLTVKPGHRVIISKFGGNDLTLDDGSEIVILHESDILAVIP